MDQMFDKSCGCQGCRSCLLCENLQTDQALRTQASSKKTEDSLTFHYIPSLGKAVCQCHDTDNGLNTVVGFEFDGVTVIEDFISLDSEFNLAKCIDLMPWKDSQSGRRKQDFGPKVNFKKQKLKTSAFTGLPDYIQPVVTMFNKVKELADFNVVELCNLEYEPDRGSSIDPHFDDTWLWGERLVTLNLLSDTHLSMINNAKYVIDVIRNVDISKTPAYFNETLKQLRTYTSSKFKNLHADQAVVKIPLQRRSLVILQGPARHEWQHSIQRRDITKRRLCCTFRELSDMFVESEVGQDLLKTASSYEGNVVL